MKHREYRAAVQKLHMPEDMRARILCRLQKQNEQQKRAAMRVPNRKRKLAAIVAAAAVMLGASALAFSNVVATITGASTAEPDYTSLPTAQTCQADAGYCPVLLERFSNGFSFADGSLVSNTMQNADGQTVETFQSFAFRYERDGDTEVNLMQSRYTSETTEDGTLLAEEDGISFYYTDEICKLVPADYEMTEQDKRDEKSGKVTFSYGSDEVQVQRVRSITWSDGDRHFCLQQADGSLTTEELLQMAREVQEG